MNKYVAESGHWYDQDGSPAYTIIGANGSERNTTLRDARKLRLVPSVTTILGVAAKPALENWKVDQAILAATTLEQHNSETLEEFRSRIKWKSKQEGKKAAERGTEIHAQIEKGFKGKSKNDAYCAVRDYLELMFPGETWFAEESFTSNLGYGGKMDLRSAAGVFVDFKTKDGLTENSDGSKLVYDEHGMQLSAYAAGANFINPERMSVFIDRKDPTIVCGYVWPQESHERHLEMFKQLLSYWKLVKKYNPNEEEK
tara:strand:+ start:2311 stop:3078 length:768 start_codon:yes stop_codon:yes gene_type:complete